MHPTQLALDFRALVAPQPYCANVVCEGLDPLALPNKELIPNLEWGTPIGRALLR